jgi:glycosyltransferase involved in cell wall biosynthesis
VLNDHDLPRLRGSSPCVFLSGTLDLGNLARLRRLSGWPRASVLGMIHSLNYSWHIQNLLLLFFSPLYRHDALMCSSTTGRETVVRCLELLNERLSDGSAMRPRAMLQTPVIPLGVEVEAFRDAADDGLRQSLDLGPGPVVLYFGRFSAASKGDLLPLILAFRRVAAQHPQASLLLAGDDTHFNMAGLLREFAARVAPQARIRVVANPGPEAKRALYATADVFVSPSDSLQETFGITVVEAMAAALPTVVSDWDGYKDLVLDGQTGFRVRTTLPDVGERFDDLQGSGAMLAPDLLAATTMVDIEQLASSIGTLVGRPDVRRAMGRAALARARALYDWPVVIGQYEALWSELAHEAAANPDTREENADGLGYRQLFGHYASDRLDHRSLVRLTGLWAEWPDCLQWVSRTVESASFFDDRIFRAIAARLEAMPWSPVGTVLNAVADDHPNEVIAAAHLCRLVKYGLVEVRSGAEALSRAS